MEQNYQTSSRTMYSINVCTNNTPIIIKWLVLFLNGRARYREKKQGKDKTMEEINLEIPLTADGRWKGRTGISNNSSVTEMGYV